MSDTMKSLQPFSALADTALKIVALVVAVSYGLGWLVLAGWAQESGILATEYLPFQYVFAGFAPTVSLVCGAVGLWFGIVLRYKDLDTQKAAAKIILMMAFWAVPAAILATLALLFFLNKTLLPLEGKPHLSRAPSRPPSPIRITGSVSVGRTS
jgi:hypothetical protein